MDGSRRTTKNGVTINRALMSGNPNYNLVRSLVAWRLKAFAAPTDISKFFNRIMLYPEDRQYISMMFWPWGPPGVVCDACAHVWLLKYKCHSERSHGTNNWKNNTWRTTGGHKNTFTGVCWWLQHFCGYPYITSKGKRRFRKYNDSIFNTTEMLGNEFTMVGGWKWFNKSDTIQLKTPTIYQGSRKKGSPLDKSRTLHENPPEYQPSGEGGAR